MTKVNQNFLKLPGSYLFSEVARRISVYSAAHPEAKIIKLSIGDVTAPLPPRSLRPCMRPSPRWAPLRASTATAPSRVTTSCGRPSPSTTTPPGAWT